MLNTVELKVKPAPIRNTANLIQAEQPWFVLSSANYYNLAASKHPAISHFYSFEADHSNGLIIAVPDGCIDICFDCDHTNPAAKICGSTLMAREIDLKHGHRYFGIRFALGVLPDFIDASAAEIIDHEWSLLDVVPDLESVLTQLISQDVFSDQIAIFNNFYAKKATRQLSSVTANAVKALCASNGYIRIKELEQVTGYTCRTLQRRFQSELGLSPKALGRIIRCQSAIHTINYLEGITFSELACDLGFSDQSHFLREFKRFVSATPGDYQIRIKNSAYFERIRQF